MKCSDGTLCARQIRARFVRADMGFIRAMAAAISAGLEHPPAVGVRVDRRPMPSPIIRFRTVEYVSGCGSPAQACVDNTRNEVAVNDV
jgi:hypothetical protein